MLVADDERDTVVTLAAILETEGHVVHGVYKGSDVIPAMRWHKPDVCVLDVDLPGPSGFALAREIKATYGDRAPLLIAISGRFKGQTDKLLGELAGFDHYCVKPCDPQDLISLIAQASPSDENAPDPTFGRALVVAAQLIGGSEALSNYLGVARRDVLAWMKGDAQPPVDAFLRVVDVLLDHVARTSADEQTTPPLTIPGAASAAGEKP